MGDGNWTQTEFVWPLDGDLLQYNLEEAGGDGWVWLSDAVPSGYYGNYWNCNWSAFEKCLELHGQYDWYLDLVTPPDPFCFRHRPGTHMKPIRAVWRRMWKYSFGLPYWTRYVEKWGVLGLVIFVAIPLPMTGVWTGGLVAFLLGYCRYKAMLSLGLGGVLSITITLALVGGVITIVSA